MRTIKKTLLGGREYRIRADWSNPDSPIEYFDNQDGEFQPFCMKVGEFKNSSDAMASFLEISAVSASSIGQNWMETEEIDREIREAVEKMGEG